MSNVIAFRKPEPEQPHISGKAHCAHCRHEWEAVAPIGTHHLECPECHAMKGLFTYGCFPPDGEMLWTCGCGCQVFTITPERVRCFECGETQTFP